MQTIVTPATISRRTHQIRLAALFVAVVITGAALVAVAVQVNAGLAASQANIAGSNAARSAADSAILLKLTFPGGDSPMQTPSVGDHSKPGLDGQRYLLIESPHVRIPTFEGPMQFVVQYLHAHLQ